MKILFDSVSYNSSKLVTKTYSTSFATAVKMLSPSIRQDIYNIYGFVRLADEIVDSFHDYNKVDLFFDLEKDLYTAITNKISINPILNAFQATVNKHQIPLQLIEDFMASMKMDLHKKEYKTVAEYQKYIYGSADVVGLMCLKVFVKGDTNLYQKLKEPAMCLGSAFQKINFLRDLKADFEYLDRSYFPNVNLKNLNEKSKADIIQEIEQDFANGYKGIVNLPIESKFGVYTAYVYYYKLLKKIKNTPSEKIKNTRIRVSDHQKIKLLINCYFKYHLNLL